MAAKDGLVGGGWWYRRHVLGGAVAVPAAMALAACTARPAAEAPGAAPAPVTLHTMSGWGDPAFWPAMERINRAFTQRFPHIRIEDNPSRQDYDAKLAAAAAAGTLPDVIKVHGTRIQQQAKQGWFISLDGYLARARAFDLGDFMKVAVELYRLQGRLYALPYDHGPLLLWYNRDLFDKAGVKYPLASWRLADLLAAARRLTKPQERVWGLSRAFLPAGGTSLHGSMLKPFGGAVVNDEETACLLDSAGSIEGLEWWAALFTRHRVVPTPEEMAGLPAGIGVEFASGLTAMHVEGSVVRESIDLESSTLIQRAGFRWDVADWPAGPRGRVAASMGSGYGITRDSKARDAAWTYLSEFLGKGKDMLMQELAATGRGSPARKSFWPAFEKSPGAPPAVGIIAPALEKYAVIGRPISPAAADINKVISQHLGQVWAGKIGPADAARAAKREIEPLLDANR